MKILSTAGSNSNVNTMSIHITEDIKDELFVTVNKVNIYKFTKARVDLDDEYGDLHVLIEGKGYVSMKELVLTYKYGRNQQ